jgi:hypothetical protein
VITFNGAGLSKCVRVLTVFCGVVVTLLALGQVSAQVGFSYLERRLRGESVAPAYEGWEPNTDGTFNLVFGYFNRNWEEHIDIPVGPNNSIEPGGPDQNQPTHFQPRRNWYVFKVKVPKDFGDKELVWTLTMKGKTEKAYATLKPEYILDYQVITRNQVGTQPGMHDNQPPIVKIDGDLRRTVKVGEPLQLNASVSDDGLLAARPGRGTRPALGLRVGWLLYRGELRNATFDPEQLKMYQSNEVTNSPWEPGWVPPPLPADGKVPARVTFRAPGSYVIRLMAQDGALETSRDVAVTVTP